ncbi:hypothetical protein LSCM1_08214 [Leishmania martiniquensis]|uniref:Uncharacterized protein n=1 Tax=Leishmania martiniquensis TaxID=1580590 RepID=A0A836HPT8_9TRYP|nr:hypothetical protein LSCM1_08214 [Leishmania martiniquensis]
MWRLMGWGNVFHAFACAQMTLPLAPLTLASPPAEQPRCLFGDYNVVTTQSSMFPAAGSRGCVPRAPPPIAPRDPSECTAQAATRVEERPFHGEDDGNDLSGAHAEARQPSAPSASQPRASGSSPSEGASSLAPTPPSSEASSAFHRLVFLAGEAHPGVAELPVAMQRIADEAQANLQTATERVRSSPVGAPLSLITSAAPPTQTSDMQRFAGDARLRPRQRP